MLIISGASFHVGNEEFPSCQLVVCKSQTHRFRLANFSVVMGELALCPIISIKLHVGFRPILGSNHNNIRRCLHKSLSLGHSQTNLHGTRLIAIFSRFSLLSILLFIGEMPPFALSFQLFNQVCLIELLRVIGDFYLRCGF